jgi:ribosome maturation protein Sdo1
MQRYEREIINNVLHMCLNWSYAYNDSDMRIEKLLKQLKWFNDFADKLEQEDLEMYLKSCEYADQKERNEIF